MPNFKRLEPSRGGPGRLLNISNIVRHFRLDRRPRSPSISPAAPSTTRWTRPSGRFRTKPVTSNRAASDRTV